MRAINYLKELFIHRFKENKPIQPNENMLKALNQIIDVVNTGICPTDFEDSLMLFYVLSHYKLVNQENEIKLSRHEKHLGILDIKGCDVILQKLSLLVSPKEFIIQEITNELNINQAQFNTPKEDYITKAQVSETLEEVLRKCKLNFFQQQNY